MTNDTILAILVYGMNSKGVDSSNFCCCKIETHVSHSNSRIVFTQRERKKER
jgi:hypothetical protein